MEVLENFVDLLFLTILFIVLMIALSFYLRQCRRSYRFILCIWGIFLVIQLFGIISCISTVQIVYKNCLNYIELSAKSNAGFAVPFANEKVNPDDPVDANVPQSRDRKRRHASKDFYVSVLNRNISRAKFWPYCFFGFVNVVFFGGVLFIAQLLTAEETTRKYADRLQCTIADLMEAKTLAEVAVETKTQFLSNMSHEIRTPMIAVLGYSDLFGRNLMPHCPVEKQDQCQTFYDSIIENGNRLLTMINNILDFSASGVRGMELQVSGSPELTRIDMKRFVNEMFQWMKVRMANKPIRLELLPRGDVPRYIWSDFGRLTQILKSLIDNAVKFTDKGSICLAYGTVDHDSSSVSSGPKRQHLIQFEIIDTGIGIAHKDLERVFLPFLQTEGSLIRRRGGIGLGLSLAKQLTEMLGGTITVKSQLGIGSTFTLTIHSEAPEGEKIEKQDKKQEKGQKPNNIPSNKPVSDLFASPTEKPLVGRRILIVEDTKINQIVISAQLIEAGAEVEFADNGQIGVEKVETSDKNIPFDVVLMDMQMPVLDGYSATMLLRQKGYVIPIIAITAHTLIEDRQKTLDVGCDDYLPKPIDADLLVETIMKYL